MSVGEESPDIGINCMVCCQNFKKLKPNGRTVIMFFQHTVMNCELA